MTQAVASRFSLRNVAFACAGLVAVALLYGLWRDAVMLSSLGASLRLREAPLDGAMAHAVGGVIEHLGVRARVHAGLALALAVGAITLALARSRARAA